MQKDNIHKTVRLLFVFTGIVLALQFFDPFTVKSVENVLLNGERLSQTYHFIDDVKTGAIDKAIDSSE